jgi:hypothetical protein
VLIGVFGIFSAFKELLSCFSFPFVPGHSILFYRCFVLCPYYSTVLGSVVVTYIPLVVVVHVERRKKKEFIYQVSTIQ